MRTRIAQVVERRAKIRRSEVRIPVQVRIFLLIWLCFTCFYLYLIIEFNINNNNNNNNNNSHHKHFAYSKEFTLYILDIVYEIYLLYAIVIFMCTHMCTFLTYISLFDLIVFHLFLCIKKIKSVAYISQGRHTGQLDSYNWLVDGSTTG